MLKMCFDINTKVFLNIKKVFLLSLHQNNFRSIIVFIITISKPFRLNIVVFVLFRFTHRYNITMLKCKFITTYDTCILSLQHSNIPMKICLFYVLSKRGNTIKNELSCITRCLRSYFSTRWSFALTLLNCICISLVCR